MKRWILTAALLVWCVPSPVPAQNDEARQKQEVKEEQVQVVITPLPQGIQPQVKEQVIEETHEANAEDRIIRAANK